MTKELKKIWKDQSIFNRKFFPYPKTFDEKSLQTKEYVLCSISELDELLRAVKWKFHRKESVKINREQVKNELTDILKYWISLCLVWDVTPEEFIQDYWRKSAVCMQRYFEEFVTSISPKSKVAVIDIDGILADYKTGFLNWCEKYAGLKIPVPVKCNYNLFKFDAESLMIDEETWQTLKHLFRTKKGKLEIPVFPEAKNFMEGLKTMGFKILVLTSRPIEQYPNIYHETLEWLKMHNIPFDYLWWSQDKTEKILENNLKSKVAFAVDDSWKYIERYSKAGIKSFWMSQKPPNTKHSQVIRISNLNQIFQHIRKENLNGGDIS